ncbi:fimbrial protein [Kluyvera sp. STS39-E]|uniref:fimbrial protein n=1 Tax=Kluyvera sp. STS39-E TaxID=3234748 RepID=UPI0034C6D1DD
MKPSLTLFLSIALSGLLISGTARATILTNCFAAGIQRYDILLNDDIESANNTAGNIIGPAGNVDSPIVATGGAAVEASCKCPPNVISTTNIYEYQWVGSPLATGVSVGGVNYGFLTENLDVHVEGVYQAANHSDDISGVRIPITEYPTVTRNRAQSGQKKPSAYNVCHDMPVGVTVAQNTYKWSVISAKMYIKKPILGVATIPQTIVVQYYESICYTNTTGCATADFQYATHVADVYLGGTLSAPLSCTINAGSTIEVDLGNIVSSQFVTRGQPPSGYALKAVDISYHCDGNAVGKSDKIKLTLTADQGVVDNSNALIAKLIGRDDLGVRVYTEDSQNVQLDGTYEFPVTVDESGDGTVHIQAAPVSTTAARPTAGKFEGNVTVKMDLK